MHERTSEDQTVVSMTDVTLSANELREVIARRAYDLYKLRGTAFGDELSDWLRAEAEVVTMLLAEPQETAGTGKRIVQPAVRTKNKRGVLKASNAKQRTVGRLPGRRNVLKNNPA